MEEKKAIIEALVFAAEAPLSVERIAEILTGTEKADVSVALQELTRDYEERKGGIHLQAVAGGYQFRTRADLSAWVKKLRTAKPVGLSPGRPGDPCDYCLPSTRCQGGYRPVSRGGHSGFAQGSAGEEAGENRRTQGCTRQTDPLWHDA